MLALISQTSTVIFSQSPTAVMELAVLGCDVHCGAGRLQHRVFITGVEGGDYWLDRKVLEKVFSGHGLVLDVFLPKGKKVCHPRRICARVLGQNLFAADPLPQRVHATCLRMGGSGVGRSW